MAWMVLRRDDAGSFEVRRACSTAATVPAFWVAYILTRPLGAASGDLPPRSTECGGLDPGTVVISHILLSVMVVLVTDMTLNATSNTDAVPGRRA